MFKRARPCATSIWRRFRALSLFAQLLLLVPAVCAILMTLLVGNVGLALMGTAMAINSLVAGWIGGALLLILGKAGLIVAKDRRRRR